MPTLLEEEPSYRVKVDKESFDQLRGSVSINVCVTKVELSTHSLGGYVPCSLHS